MDFAHYFNGLIDTMDPKTAGHVHQDLALVFLFETKSQRDYEPRFTINRIGRQLVRDILAIDRETGLEMLNGWGIHMKANIESPQYHWTLEEYEAYRLEQGAASWAVDSVSWSAGLHVSLAEKESTRYFMNDIMTACLLVNDLISFEKEFDDHAKNGTLHKLRNAVAVLMTNYGYSEKEARDIIRKESLAMEKAGLLKYENWKYNGAPKSDDLRKFVIFSMLMCSGSAYWMSHSPRYNRSKFSNTVEMRAGIIGKHHGDLKALRDRPKPTALASTGYPMKLMNPFQAPFIKASAQFVDAPYEYLISLPGKMMRDKLIEGLNEWLKVPDLSLNIIKDVIGMLHSSSLMLDDIEDGSLLRRGRPSVHVLYGQSQTINSANYIYVKSVAKILTLKGATCLEIFIELGPRLALLYNGYVPSVESYITMVDNKTGGLFRLIVRLMQAESTVQSTPDLLKLATLFGRYYQIRDDYYNLTSEEFAAKKGFCEDISEGKLSLPVIHMLKSCSSSSHLRAVLFSRISNVAGEISFELKSFVLAAMKKEGSLDYVKEVLEKLHVDIMDLVEKVESELGWNAALKLLVLGSST